MQILWLMQTHSMLCTYTTIPFRHLFENILIMPLHLLLIRNNIDMNIPITNMPIPKHLLSRFPQMRSKFNPLFYIKTNIISKVLSLISSQHCHLLTHLPYLLKLRIVSRENSILHLNTLLGDGLEYILKFLAC